MHPHAIRCFATFALASLLIAPRAVALDAVTLPSIVTEAMAQAASPQAIAEYQRKLAEYQEAHAPVDAYWTSITDKRRGRNAKRREHQQITLDDYVLTQPPVYNGPATAGLEPETQPGPSPPRERKAIPVVADLLARPPASMSSNSRLSARRTSSTSSAPMRVTRWPQA